LQVHDEDNAKHPTLMWLGQCSLTGLKRTLNKRKEEMFVVLTSTFSWVSVDKNVSTVI